MYKVASPPLNKKTNQAFVEENQVRKREREERRKGMEGEGKGKARQEGKREVKEKRIGREE